MPSCAIFGCHNSTRKTKGKNIRYYSFPKDPELVEKWINACQRKNLNPKTSYVCSVHFTPSDIFVSLRFRLTNYEPKNTRNLKDDAVPTKMLPYVDSKDATNKTSSKELITQQAEVMQISKTMGKQKPVIFENGSFPNNIDTHSSDLDTQASEISIVKNELDSFISKSEDQEPNSREPSTPPIAFNNLQVIKCLLLKSANNNMQPSNLIRKPVGDVNKQDVIKSVTKPQLSETGNQESQIKTTTLPSSTPVNLLVIASNNVDMKSSNLKSPPAQEVVNEMDMMKQKIDLLTFENSNLLSRCQRLVKENQQLVQHVKNANGNFSKRLHKLLKPVFTPGQIKRLLHPEKSSIRWCMEDMVAAMALRKVSPKAYRYLSQHNYPLPPRSTLTSRAWTAKLNRNQEASHTADTSVTASTCQPPGSISKGTPVVVGADAAVTDSNTDLIGDDKIDSLVAATTSDIANESSCQSNDIITAPDRFNPTTTMSPAVDGSTHVRVRGK